MSKWKQIRKTKLLKEKRNPATRLEKITHLKRDIKSIKSKISEQKKQVDELEHKAHWSRIIYEADISRISALEKELADLEEYDKQEKEKMV